MSGSSRFCRCIGSTTGNGRRSMDVQATCRLRLEYSYQFRQADNGVELDEWNGPRIAVADPATPRGLAAAGHLVLGGHRGLRV